MIKSSHGLCFIDDQDEEHEFVFDVKSEDGEISSVAFFENTSEGEVPWTGKRFVKTFGEKALEEVLDELRNYIPADYDDS